MKTNWKRKTRFSDPEEEEFKERERLSKCGFSILKQLNSHKRMKIGKKNAKKEIENKKSETSAAKAITLENKLSQSLLDCLLALRTWQV